MSLGAQGKRRNPDKTNKLTCSYDEYRNYELGVFFSSTNEKQLYALNCKCQVHDPRSKSFRGLDTERERRAGVVILPIPFSLRSNPFAMNQRVLELVECDVDATSDGFLPREYFYEENGGVLLETVECDGKRQFNRISDNAKVMGVQSEWKVAVTQREPGVREEKGIVKVLEMQQIFHHEQLALASKANKKKGKINMLEVFTQQDFHVDEKDEMDVQYQDGEYDDDDNDDDDDEEEEEAEEEKEEDEAQGNEQLIKSKDATASMPPASASMSAAKSSLTATATAAIDHSYAAHSSQQSQTSTPSKSQDAALLIF